jgi:hypothetical protein
MNKFLNKKRRTSTGKTVSNKMCCKYHSQSNFSKITKNFSHFKISIICDFKKKKVNTHKKKKTKQKINAQIRNLPVAQKLEKPLFPSTTNINRSIQTM